MAKIDSNYKYLTYEEMAKDVAEQVLDCFLYDGKSIRKWIQVIASEDVISRQAVLDIDFKRIILTTAKPAETIEQKVKALPPVTPPQQKTGYISIDDVMSVFDDFMCGEVDEDGTDTFLEMLKDKAESEE